MRLLRSNGIPKVFRVADPHKTRFKWEVIYPGPFKTCGYECCPVEEFAYFKTWLEAVHFAIQNGPRRKSEVPEV